MTAPDVNADVRARFEAWHDQRWPEPDNCRHKVDWRSAKHAKWTVWQAAHADLSGEVRELVEALQELRYACTDKAERMADAALAKFTQQEKER